MTDLFAGAKVCTHPGQAAIDAAKEAAKDAAAKALHAAKDAAHVADDVAHGKGVHVKHGDASVASQVKSHCTVLYCTALALSNPGIPSGQVALHCTALYCTVLYCFSPNPGTSRQVKSQVKSMGSATRIEMVTFAPITNVRRERGAPRALPDQGCILPPYPITRTNHPRRHPRARTGDEPRLPNVM